MAQHEFNGKSFHDDRMYLLYRSKCTIDETELETISTIYHEEIPENYVWCIVTYENSGRYHAVKVDHFDTQLEMDSYFQFFAPKTPLVSLRGKAPEPPLSYEHYVDWLKENGISEYDYKSLYLGNATNSRETIYQKR